MSSNTQRSWERPWSTQEIIDNASNWSLAGDAGLLKHLEQFAEDLFSKAEEMNNGLNKLQDNLNAASLNLDLVRNEFHSLQNTQFIENRVYEEDETLVENNKSAVEDAVKQTEEGKIKNMKEAVLTGLKVIDQYYDKVEVPASDSDDDTDFPSFVLRPKDCYADRPLPYIIGTQEWYKKWHVGLEDTSSESDNEKGSDKCSESEDDLPVPDQARVVPSSSETSDSEVDFSNRIGVHHPAASTDGNKQSRMFSSSDNEEYNSASIHQVPSTDNKFAQQLMAKLDDVIGNTVQKVNQDVNKKPIQKPTTVGNLFSDEPPPLDDDLFSVNKPGLVTGGLFDDNDDDDLFWGGKQIISKVVNKQVPDLFDEHSDDLFTDVESVKKDTVRSKEITGGLFNDEDDDDLFNISVNKKNSKTTFLEPNKIVIPFFDEEPPDVEPRLPESPKTESKKPFGGVSILGNSKIINDANFEKILKDRRQSSDIVDGELQSKTVKPVSMPPASFAEVGPKKDIESSKIKLCHEDVGSDLFEDNSFPSLTTKSSNLFDEDLFNVEHNLGKSNVFENRKHISLFSEDEDDLGDDLFGEYLSRNTKKAIKIDLFDSNVPDLDDLDDLDIKADGKFPKSTASFASNESPKPFQTEINATVTDNSSEVFATRQTPLEGDFIKKPNDNPFVANSKVVSPLDKIPELSVEPIEHNLLASENLFDISQNSKVSKVSLFDDDDADDADDETNNLFQHLNKSDENNFETEDIRPQTASSPGKLKHSLNINVNALMPGGTPPKRSNFKKAHSLDASNQDNSDDPAEKTKSNEELITKNENLNNNTASSVEILPSITKDRIKIPVKRRPSTRKGRQESLRKSIPDFKLDLSSTQPTVDCAGDTSQHAMKEADGCENMSLNLNQNSFYDLFVKDEDDDLFSSKPSDKVTKSLFDSSVISEQMPKTDRLFVHENVQVERRSSFVNSTNFESLDFKKTDLFDDPEDDIFDPKKLPPKSAILKRSLFDDEFDDDEDLFGTPSLEKNAVNRGSATVAVEKKIRKASTVRVLENAKVIDDPLQAFQKE